MTRGWRRRLACWLFGHQPLTCGGSIAWCYRCRARLDYLTFDDYERASHYLRHHVLGATCGRADCPLPAGYAP